MLQEIIYLNPSHQHSNIGVDGYGTEAQNCYDVAVEVKRLLDATGHFKAVHVGAFNLTLVQSIADSNAKNATLHLDIHTDAGGSRGATAFYKSQGGLKFANCIYKRVSEVTPTEDRGVRYRGDLGCLNQTNAIASLVEMFFHDSYEDVRFFKAHKQLFARAIAMAVCDYYNVAFVEPVKVIPSGSDFVRKLQSACNALGIKDAEGKSLFVDGLAGRRTYEALSKVILKQGKTGTFVKLVQSRLGIRDDGIFGSGTKARVVEFQRVNGLSADGIIGINTWKALCR